MTFTMDGKMVFDDIYDLTYNILNELSISLLPDGSLLYRNENNGEKKLLQMDGKRIVASVDPNNIHYPGPMDINFDILNDIKMVMFIFGFYLEHEKGVGREGGMPYLSHFPEEKIITFKPKKHRTLPDIELKFTAQTIKLTSASSVTSSYYHNRCLRFIDLIFCLEEDPVDLTNFDYIDLEAEEEALFNSTRRR